MTNTPKTLADAVNDLRDQVRWLEHDPSPHAPEIPFTLREALQALFDAYAELGRELL